MVPAPTAPVRLSVATAPAPVPPRLPANASRPVLPARTSRLAIASLVCSCAGLLLGFLGTIPGIICGGKALRQIKNTPGLTGKAMATAGLIVGCVLSVLWIPLTYILVVATISGFHAVSELKARQKATPAPVAAVANTDVATDLTLDGSAWRPDLEGVAIPATLVAGRVHGLPFTVQTVKIDPRNGEIEFEYDNTGVESSKAAWKQISLRIQFNQEIGSATSADPAAWFEANSVGKYSQRTYTVQSDGAFSVQPPASWDNPKPQIRMYWLEPGPQSLDVRMKKRSQSAPLAYEKYALRLELGELKNGKLPGRIYLCVLDQKKSFICGTFVANVAQDSNLPLNIQPDAAGWTLDVGNATIPETLAAGRLNGIPFKTQAVQLSSTFGELTFSQGVWPNNQEFKLDLRVPDSSEDMKNGRFNNPARFSGRTIIVAGNEARHDQPDLRLTPLPAGVDTKYVMRLEFGELKDGRLPGRIYLCILDRGKSFIRGKFVVVPQ